MRDPDRDRLLLLVLFGLSGLVGIQYEILWLRFFTHVVGTGIQAVSAVVTAFMLGLALGSVVCGRLADRVSNPLRLYALLEVSVGLLNLAAFGLFALGDDLYAVLYEHFSYAVVKWLVFALAFLFVTLPASLIGGTLPVLLKHLVASEEDVQTDPGRLYAINMIGAALGALLLVNHLLPALGYTMSLLVACAGGVTLGGVVWLISRGVAPRGAESAPSEGEERAAPDNETDAALLPGWMVLGAYSLSGFASLGYEVVWSRQLVYVFRGTLEGFAMVLAIFLTGMTIGNVLAIPAIRRGVDPRAMLGGLSLAVGVLGTTTLLFTWRFGYGPLLGLGILLVTIPIGAMFPLAVLLHHRGLKLFGRTLGDVYAWNTLGSIAGSFATGFIIVPLVGGQWAFMILVGIHLAIGTLFLGRYGAGLARWVLPAASVILVGAGVVALPADAILTTHFRDQGRVIHASESALEPLTVVETRDGERLLYGGPFLSGTTARRHVQITQGHLAMLLHPGPNRVLEIGYGVGDILRCITKHPAERIDLVEIDPHMVPVADAWFGAMNQTPTHDPRVRVLERDGRLFLAMTPERYDVIMSDTFYVMSEASTRLYTREHFENGAAHLVDGGLMAVWIPRSIGDGRVEIIANTFRQVFPHVFAWGSSESETLFLFGFKEEPRFDLAALRRRYQAFAAQDMTLLGYRDCNGLLTCFRLGPQALATLFPSGAGPVHRDLAPRLDFAPRGGFQPDAPLNRALREGSPRCLLPYLSSAEDRADLAALVERFDRAEAIVREATEPLTTSTPVGELATQTWAAARTAEIEPVVARLEEALAICPEHTAARELVAMFCARRGFALRAEGAEPEVWQPWLERALRHQPYKGDAAYVLGSGAWGRGEVETARPLLERCLDLSPYLRLGEQSLKEALAGSR